jgi:hypothetical protein
MTDLSVDAVGLALTPIEPADAARMEIAAEFERYGQHPACFRCPMDCKQYNAPDSVIVYCPNKENHV